MVQLIPENNGNYILVLLPWLKDISWWILTLVDKSLSDITDSSQLDHRANGVTLDGLVLGDAAGAVRAANGLDVAASVLVASVISSLEGLFWRNSFVKGDCE